MDNELNYEKLKNLFEKANKSFLENNKTLIDRDLSERCLCANLAYELRDEFKKYNDVYVDVEFNRDGYNIKKVYSYIKKDNRNVVCDLIIHDRDKNNYLALEMKKIPGDEDSINKDKDRLEVLTMKDYYSYRIGVFYEFLMDRRIIRISYFKNGKLDELKEGKFTFDNIPSGK